ncbi:hypothetical protein [Nocardia sp. NBC_00416]|uniref:hypothetical protein n=1 Tax=Nocardia sp. NBC_00416 TaxID=2975991 RepID=UPI002E1F5ADB
MDSKTKVAGPLAAAGAVSLGLVLIGACGIGQDDTYVPPPPIRSGPQAAEQVHYTGEVSTSVAKVLIPPSPSWRMAPEPPPRRTLPPEYQISVTASTPPGAEDDPTGDESATSTRPVTLSATPGPTPPTEPNWTTASVPGPEIAPAYTESPVPAPAPPTTVVTAPVPTNAETAAPGAPEQPPAPPAAEGERAAPGAETTETPSEAPAPTPTPEVQSAPRAVVPTTETPTPDRADALPGPVTTEPTGPIRTR